MYTGTFDLGRNCDLSRLDYAFLGGFNGLASLTISESSNVPAFDSLPSNLPSLSTLVVFNSPKRQAADVKVAGREQTVVTSIPSLRILTIANCAGFVDQQLVGSISRFTGLRNLTVNSSQLNDDDARAVLDVVARLPKLHTLDLSGNSISAFGSGGVVFNESTRVLTLSLAGNRLTAIENGTFQGVVDGRPGLYGLVLFFASY